MSTTAPPTATPTAPPTGPEYLTAIRDGWAQAMQQWVDQSTSAWDQWAQWSQGWAGAVPASAGVGASAGGRPTKPGHRHPRHDHAHDHRHDCMQDHACGCCGDACDCCVPEADVVVHARAGEVRVVPFRLANRWRREREVTLAVGPWHVCRGEGMEVLGVIEEEKVVLAPCEDRIVRLLISVRGAVKTGKDSSDATDPAKPAQKDQANPGPDVMTTFGRRTLDVDECTSAYADVRFEGCSRPLRVAVVVSPAHCDPVDACCDCGCC
jgi:hypothetical protein